MSSFDTAPHPRVGKVDPDTPGHALEWDCAYDVCATVTDWETHVALEVAAEIEAATAPPGTPRPEPGTLGTLATLTAALIVEYTSHGRDADVIRACLAAAREQYGDSWTVRQFQAVTMRFSARFDGWEEIGRDYLDEHCPHFPDEWIKDLAQVGWYARRETALYITLDRDTDDRTGGTSGRGEGPVYVFERLS